MNVNRDLRKMHSVDVFFHECFLTVAVVVYTEDQTDASALELSKKRTVLAGFCKLISYNVIDLKLVSPVFAFLIKVCKPCILKIISHTIDNIFTF